MASSRSANTVPLPVIEWISFVGFRVRFRPTVIYSRLPFLSDTAHLKSQATVYKIGSGLRDYSPLAGDARAI